MDAVLKQTCLLLGARCVRKLDDSQIHANRTTFRTLLRSSSLQEPRDPLLKVVNFNRYNDFVKHASVNIETLRTRAYVLHPYYGTSRGSRGGPK